ncbi:hypothetical protein WN59_10965 [Salinicoccus sediminis]|uniref:Lipoprotein n=1 Tax=Salinicoccus sediminis TaxID=1432562 RepID=A0A0M2SII6_9STAP|nr:hypothetical protein [Salinicoccus sediminis]KKK34103.1 hypothetical protein WN59_10965 [Salinicoccus sediminis]
MIDIRRFILCSLFLCSAAVLSACSDAGSSIDYEVIGKTESGDSGAFASSIQQITDEEMLRMAIEQTGADIDPDAVDFDSEHLFQVSMVENGCGYLLEDLVNEDGTLRFMFELTPVVESGEDPEDVTCAEVAVPTTSFIKTEAVDFSSLEIYGSGEKIESE